MFVLNKKPLLFQHKVLFVIRFGRILVCLCFYRGDKKEIAMKRQCSPSNQKFAEKNSDCMFEDEKASGSDTMVFLPRGGPAAAV